MSTHHFYASLGTTHRSLYTVPARHDLPAWERWAWHELGIAVLHTALPALIVGVAVLLQTEHLKGLVILAEAQQFPLWWLCHEIGHLMTGQGYSVDAIQDGAAWQRVPAEVAATEYALCLLIDEHDLMDRLSDGLSKALAAQAWCVPESAIEWRLRLAGVPIS